MKLLRVSIDTDASTVRLEGHLRRADQSTTQVYFQFPVEYRDFVEVAASPFLIAMLVPAMLAGEPVESDVPISPELAFGLRRVQGLMHFWYPELRPVPLCVPEEPVAPEPSRERAMSFFSGGVDSLYTFLRYHHGERLPSPLTHIVMVRGIETKLEIIAGVEESERSVADVAASIGAHLILGETNIRSVFRAHWENYYVGSGLAATAYALARGFDYAAIPSTHSYRNVIPQGSSPVLDELFSTPRLRLIHDGADARRPDKVARILQWAPDIVVQRLRVCTRNRGGDMNCGRCYKCVRTAISLEALGRLNVSTLFRDTSRGHWVKTVAADHLDFLQENLDFAREHAASPGLIALLERAMRRHRRHEAFRRATRASKILSLLNRSTPTRQRG